MNVILSHEALGEERLDTMKIACSVIFISLRLFQCGFRSRNRCFSNLDFVSRSRVVRQCALLARVCCVDSVDLRGDSTGFILDLAFQLCLSSECALQGIQVWPIINLVEQATLLDEFVIVNG